MKTFNNLPLISLDIDESDMEAGLDAIALVDKPAVKKNYLMFGEHQKLTFSEDRRIISGVAMLADTPIYRNDSSGEYYVTFTADTVQRIAHKFFKDGRQSSVNLMHDDGQKVDGVTFFESFIIDKARGVQPMKGFENVPDGSWMVSAYVEDENTWEMIKESGMQGFSVQGMFSKSLAMSAEEAFLESVEALLKEL